jgi:Tol biopolymer transport system component
MRQLRSGLAFTVGIGLAAFQSPALPDASPGGGLSGAGQVTAAVAPIKFPLGPTVETLSVSYVGGAANAASRNPVVSADARYVAFESSASDLVAGDGNGLDDVFVRDRTLGTTIKVSEPGTGGRQPSMSADGRFVAYEGAVGGGLYLKDLLTGTLTQVSNPGLSLSFPSASSGQNLSANGRYLVYYGSAATTVGSAYVYDAQTSAHTLVSLGANGLPVPLGTVNGTVADYVAISGDGRYVFWDTDGSVYVTGTDPVNRDIIRRNWRDASPVNERVSIGDGGDQSSPTGGAAYEGSVSATGEVIAFQSYATNYVSSDANGATVDVFLRRPALNQTKLGSLGPNGLQFTSDSLTPHLSYDARYLAFVTSAGLVAGDGNNASDVYIRDTIANTTFLLSANVTLLGTTAAGGFNPYIAARVGYAAFESDGQVKGRRFNRFPAGSVSVTFVCDNASTVPGENIYLVGSASELGQWMLPFSIKMDPTAATQVQSWRRTVTLPATTYLEYKFVRRADSNPYWDAGALLWTNNGSGPYGNYTATTPAGGSVEWHGSY